MNLYVNGSVSVSMEGTSNDTSWLPPGFRFHPTDEELVSFYLVSKILDPNFSDQAISEADLNKCEPWELPGKARMGEKEWYFYSLKDRKYPTGVRTNRATLAGYWKATGKDREVMSSRAPLKGKLIGMKKTLVFYQGRAPKGTKSNWVMHEYRAEDALKISIKSKSSKDEWVLCRIFHKTPGGKKMALIELQMAAAINSSCGSSHNVDSRIAKMAATLPPLTEIPWHTPPSQASLPCSQMSGQNMLGHAYQPCSYMSGQGAASLGLLSGNGASSSHAPTGLAGGQNQLANLLNSLQQRGNVDSGSPAFKSLFQQYSEQVKVERKEDCHVPPGMEELDMAAQRSMHAMHLQVPVPLWEEVGMGGQNVNTMVTCGRRSPDSCVSTLECAPSPPPYMQHQPLARLPSDLDYWLSSDHIP